MLGIMSAEDKPVAMLGVATALNPADVDLLIAAPDLLYMCEMLELLLEKLAQQEDLNLAAKIQSFRDSLRAAIAKAKGETDVAKIEGGA